MFNQREVHPPDSSTMPESPPAGFRFVDYINPRRCFKKPAKIDLTDMGSPDPSPLNSPVKGRRPLAEDSSSILLIPGRFPKPDRPQATRPFTPTPNEQRSENIHMDASAQAPLPQPEPRKAKRGSKHLSFTKGRNGSGTIPHHRYAQKMKEKAGTGHRQFRDRRRVPRPGSLASLRKEAQKLMKPEYMNDADRIFLEQIQELEMNENEIHGLEQCRERTARAAADAHQRRKEHVARDKAAAKLWGGHHDEEAEGEQQRKVAEFLQDDEEIRQAHFRAMEEAALRADEERQRAHDARERQLREEQERRLREELVRKAEEERREREKEEERRREVEELRQREERERQEREQRLRNLQERVREFQRREQAFSRRIREEQQRRERDERQRTAKKERERLRERMERERVAREEAEHRARLLAEQAAAEKAERERQQFLVYESKWNELRSNDALHLVEVWDMPWPVFGFVSSAEVITYEDVRQFLFHPQRPGVEGKTARDKVKVEVLRFHPDKFNTRILPKIKPSQQAGAQAIAGAVVRILTTIMTEEAEQQN